MNTRKAERDYRQLEDFLSNQQNDSSDLSNQVIGWIDYNPETGEERFRENPNYNPASDYEP